ncbi:hypothetical protein TIFTF001_016368 [Ficus carica]|uniref:Uncharacterized protein n=1 Tax=Ficus carica TaxID=3494 RepID=A0AA88A7G2_FICCA|nr:hypothetical protein TIFTF001_016368 [Ficus carica]
MSDVKKTLEWRSARVPAKSSKCKPADESGQYVQLVPDSEITKAKINTFVNITETRNKLSQWLSPRQYEAIQGQPCIQSFMHLETLGWAGQVFHNTVMRLTNHSAMGDALWFQLGKDLGRFSINEGVSRENLELQMSNAKFDNNDDAVKLSLL